MQKFVDDLLYKNECYTIIGIRMKIHSILGHGFKEIVYKDAMEVEFEKIKFHLKGKNNFGLFMKELKRKFTADFLVYSSIVLEIKALYAMPATTFRQKLNYIKTSEVQLGIMINFGESRLKFQRVICTH